MKILYQLVLYNILDLQIPFFKDLLNEQEVTAVAEYVKSLRVYAEEAATDSTAVDSTK